MEHRTSASEKSVLAERAVSALESAQTSREQLQLAVDAADLAVWYYEPVRNVVGGDARLGTFFGLSELEGPAEIWLNAIVSEDRARVGDEFAASLAGAPYDIQYCVEVYGLRRCLHARAKITPQTDGTIRMIGVCEDITEQTTLAADLKRPWNGLLSSRRFPGPRSSTGISLQTGSVGV